MKKIITILLFLILVACDRSDEAATPVPDTEVTAEITANTPAVTTEPDTIILQMALYDWEAGGFRNLIETFEAENPDIQIKTVSIEEILGLGSGGVGQWPEDAARRLVSSADVITTNAIGSTSGKEGLLLDLQPFIETDANFSRDDFYPNALELFETDSRIWGLPTQINFTLLFYQKDAFDNAGIPYPAAGWTWDDFLAAAQATTVQDGQETTRWGFVQSNNSPFPFVLPRVKALFDTSTDPPTPQLDQPEVAAALQWFADLHLVHQVAPILEQPEPDEDGTYIPAGYELIENGQAAMWPEWSGSWAWRSSQMNLGVVPFPVAAPADKTTQIFATGYTISAGTRHPEAAWRWLDYLTRQPSLNDFGGETAVPARISVAEASGFWDNIAPELRQALRYALDHSYLTTFTSGYAALFQASEAVIRQGKPVAEALAEAQAQAETTITEVASDQAEGGDTGAVVVAAPEVEAIPAGATIIQFAAGSGPGGIQPYRDLAETFRDLHPDIVVEVQPPDFGSGPTGLSDVATTADCLQWFGGITNQEDQAAVLNLEPFLDADPELSQADFYSQALDTFTYQGQLWGLPAEMNISVINYNKTLFDEARVPYPQPDWTTDDFLAAAVALTQGDDPATRQYGYVPQEFEINDLTTFLERLSAQFLDENEDPPQLSFTHPTMVEAMRWVTSLTTEFAVKPTFITNIGEGAFGLGEERKALIENGRAAMWSDQGFPTFPEINLDDLAVGIAPLPAGPDGTVTASNAITGYFISATTAQRQACWQWITFLSQQPFTGTYGNTFPARRTVAESAAYAQAVGPEQAAANLASVENITGPSVALRLSTDANWLTLGHFWWQSYAYHQILTASVPVEEALAAVQAKADAYRDCVIQRDGLADQNIQRTCLGEVDDTVPPSWLEIDEAE